MIQNTCIVIPAYNEQSTIREVVSRSRRQSGLVCVIDDGSTDSTYQEAISAGAIVLRHETNRGYSQALKTGFSYTFNKGFEKTILLDGDGQHLPEEIPILLNKLSEGYDVVIGRRNFRLMPLLRRTGNFFYSRFVSSLAKTDVPDPRSGFRVFKNEVLPLLLAINGNPFSYWTDTIIDLLNKGVIIGWAGISTVYKKDRIARISSKDNFKDLALMGLRYLRTKV